MNTGSASGTDDRTQFSEPRRDVFVGNDGRNLLFIEPEIAGRGASAKRNVATEH